ncbi:MAG: DUF2065 domain-containing protein [Deltaproteobacteria bacterium]|jgi:uncharacterized protein YjeT (DUF2065 family)|nr:MAG: DUF2065 domain-containing protein [Deltaproteobacteria bacterium]
MKLLFTMIGLVFILEGLPYLTFPEAMQRWLKQLMEMQPSQLRIVGLFAVVIGLIICYVTLRTNLFN